MSSCLDGFICQNGCFEWEIWSQVKEKRNIISSFLAGFLFSVGWWIIIDTSVQYPSQSELHPACHTCGVISTIALILINCVPESALRDNTSYDRIGYTGAKLWLFFGFVLGFAALIASSWILFGVYVVPAKPDPYPGVAIFLQNAFIFMGGVIFKFGRTEENW